MRTSSRARPRRKCALPWFQSLIQECAKKRMLHCLIHAAQPGAPEELCKAAYIPQPCGRPCNAGGRVHRRDWRTSDEAPDCHAAAPALRCSDSRVIAAEIERRIAPDFTEARNIVGHNGAARQRRLQRRKAKWLVLRGRNVDRSRGSAAPSSHLRKALPRNCNLRQS